MRKLVATVTPIYKRELSIDEQISLRHLRQVLGAHDRIIIAPEGLHIDFPDFEIRRFREADFKSIQSYNRLMLSKRFYSAFYDYEYILIYLFFIDIFSSIF